MHSLPDSASFSRGLDTGWNHSVRQCLQPSWESGMRWRLNRPEIMTPASLPRGTGSGGFLHLTLPDMFSSKSLSSEKQSSACLPSPGAWCTERLVWLVVLWFSAVVLGAACLLVFCVGVLMLHERDQRVQGTHGRPSKTCLQALSTPRELALAHH